MVNFTTAEGAGGPVTSSSGSWVYWNDVGGRSVYRNTVSGLYNWKDASGQEHTSASPPSASGAPPVTGGGAPPIGGSTGGSNGGGSYGGGSSSGGGSYGGGSTGGGSYGGGSSSATSSGAWSEPYVDAYGNYVQKAPDGRVFILTQGDGAVQPNWDPPYVDPTLGKVVQKSPDGRVFILGDAATPATPAPSAGEPYVDPLTGKVVQEMPDGTIRVIGDVKGPAPKPAYQPNASQMARSDAANAALLAQRMQLEAAAAEREQERWEEEAKLARARLDIEQERLALDKAAAAEQKAKTYAQLISSVDLGALPAFLAAGGGSVANATGAGADMLTDNALAPAAMLGADAAGGGGASGGGGGGTSGGADPDPAPQETTINPDSGLPGYIHDEWVKQGPAQVDPYLTLLNQMLRDPESPVHHMNPAEQQAFVRGKVSNDAPMTPLQPTEPVPYDPNGVPTANIGSRLGSQIVRGEVVPTDKQVEEFTKTGKVPMKAFGGTTKAKTFISGDPQVAGTPNPELVQIEGPQKALSQIETRVTPFRQAPRPDLSGFHTALDQFRLNPSVAGIRPLRRAIMGPMRQWRRDMRAWSPMQGVDLNLARPAIRPLSTPMMPDAPMNTPDVVPMFAFGTAQEYGQQSGNMTQRQRRQMRRNGGVAPAPDPVSTAPPGVEGGTGGGTTAPVQSTNPPPAVSVNDLNRVRGDRLQGFKWNISPWSLEFQRQSPLVQASILADWQREKGTPSEQLSHDVGMRALRGAYGQRAVGY